MDVRRPLAVVTPTLDGDVLARLALVNNTAFTPGQLQRLLPDKSVDGIRKVLVRLARQGIVTTTRVGNAAITYQLNREHLAAEPIIALASQAATLRQRIEQALAQWLVPPVYAAVFGSWARGHADEESDIDVFLVRPADLTDSPADAADRGIWDAEVAALEDAISRWTGNDARAFVLGADELDESDGVLTSIIAEGLTVYGQPGWLRSAVRRRGAGSVR